ncbi:MAG: hypothetical protein AAF449_13580, partial [Myxococcota bacterium]
MAKEYGPHLERLDAVAASNGFVAIGGARDTPSAASQIHLFNRRGEHRASIDVNASVCALTFVFDDILIAGTDDGRLIGTAITDGAPQRLFTLSAHRGAVRALCADVLRRRLWSVGDDGMLVPFEVQGPQLQAAASVKASDGPLHTLAIDREQRRLATAGVDGQVRIFDPDALGEGPRRTMAVGEGELFSLVFTEDGRLVAGGGDGTIRLVYTEGAPDEQDRSGDDAHKGAVHGIIFGPALRDAADKPLPRRLFSIADDGDVRIWGIDNKRKPKSLSLGRAHPRGVSWLSPPAKAKPEQQGGHLLIVDRRRRLTFVALGKTGEPTGETSHFGRCQRQRDGC